MRSKTEFNPGEDVADFIVAILNLLLTLAFARYLDPTQLAAFLNRHHVVHAARLQAYRQQLDAAKAEGADPRDLITLDFGVRYETAVLDWFNHLPSDLAADQHVGAGDQQDGDAVPGPLGDLDRWT